VINQRSHYILAEREERRRRRLGLPATVIASFVAVFTFAKPSSTIVYVVGGLATISAMLIAAQTYLGPAEAARQHHQAGVEFGTLKRKFDLLLLRDDQETLHGLEALYPELDQLAQTSRIIPDRVYRKARAEIERSGPSYVGR
jgi:hypothetical protein